MAKIVKETNLYIVDDRPLIRDLLTFYFSRKKRISKIIVCSKLDHNELFQQSKVTKIILIIGGSSKSVIQQTLMQIAQLPQKFSTILIDNRVKYSTLHLLVDQKLEGYLTFFDTHQDLMSAIDKVLVGEIIVSQHASHIVHKDETSLKVHPSCPNPHFFRLSKRERELFERIVNGEDMSECSTAMGLTEKSCSNLKTRLMLKLGAQTTTKLIILGTKYGLNAD